LLEGEVGVQDPLGFFDPLGLLDDADMGIYDTIIWKLNKKYI